MYKLSIPIIGRHINDENRKQYADELKRAKADRVFVTASLDDDLDVMRAKVEYFKDNGFEVGIWIGNTIGHGATLFKLKETGEKPKYQRLVNLEGKDLIGTNCPLDKNFREYLAGKIAGLNGCGTDLLMIDDDLNLNALPTTNTIKTIVTAETPIDLERKGVQSRQGIVNCRFLCFGNGALTSLYDHSDGFYRRQIVLHTRPRPRDRVDDPFLADKLIEELPGILLWCLEGLKRLQAQDYRFTISEATAMAMQQIRRESDNILEFMHSEGYLRFSHDARIPSSVLYRCYEDWCRDNSCRPFASNTFLARLREREDDFDIAYSTHIPYAGKRVRGFIGLCTADKPFGT